MFTATTTRRIRILQKPQSHGGCFRCKKRRVKCDENKPSCLRCVKADRSCEYAAFPDDCAPSNALSTLVVPNAPPATSDQAEVARFVALACSTLHCGASSSDGAAASFWSYTLPQLGHSHPVVTVAATALGCAIHGNNQTASPPSSTLRWYVRALEEVRSAVAGKDPASTPVIAACMLLAITEILQQQELPALAHLQGALTLLIQRQKLKLPHDDMESSSFHIHDEVDAAGAALDISTASYALGLSPRLPTLAVQLNQSPSPSLSFSRLEEHVLHDIHAGYDFAARYNQWRYVPERFRPNDTRKPHKELVDSIFRRIADLKMFAETSAFKMSTCNLQAQASSCLIYVACLFDSRESAYDRFATVFEDIIHVVERSPPRDLYSSGSPNLSLDLGIIQPLFFTAVKCRIRNIRERAIALLDREDREGPFEGKGHAAVARRALEIEEAASKADESVPEAVRLHGCGVVTPGGRSSNITTAAFSRCMDVEAMMLETTADGYKHSKWWDIWEEQLAR